MKVIPAPGESIVLDSEGLSRLINRDKQLVAITAAAVESRWPIVVSAATIVEVVNKRSKEAEINWTLSRIDVMPVTKALALAAASLLVEAGLHGHQHALDSLVAATALGLPGTSTIFTSDQDDFKRLVGRRAAIVPLR
jgi:hypothetical protein